MSQHDFDIANQSFPAFRSDLNLSLKALASNSSGASAPTTTYAGMLWYDTTNGVLWVRNGGNTAWIELATLDNTNNTWYLSLNTTTPAFRITQTGTGNAFVVEDAASPDGTPFVINNGGDVGIGTDTPTFNVANRGVHISSTLTSGVRVQSTAGSDLEITASTGSATIRQVANLPLAIHTNNAEILRWNGNGALSLGNSGTNFGTAGSPLVTNGSGSAPSWGPILDHGVYAPTITGVTNVASVTTPATQFQYSRVGNTVTVSGRIQFAATAATTDTTVGISLPIASTITSVYFVAGTGACVSASAFGESGAVTGDSTNNRASFLCRPSATASRLWSVQFTYKIA